MVPFFRTKYVSVTFSRFLNLEASFPCSTTGDIAEVFIFSHTVQRHYHGVIAGIRMEEKKLLDQRGREEVIFCASPYSTTGDFQPVSNFVQRQHRGNAEIRREEESPWIRGEAKKFVLSRLQHITGNLAEVYLLSLCLETPLSRSEEESPRIRGEAKKSYFVLTQNVKFPVCRVCALILCLLGVNTHQFKCLQRCVLGRP